MFNRRSFSFLKKVWLLVSPFKIQILAISLLTVLYEAVKMAVPYFFGRILDILVQNQGLVSIETALLVVAGLVGIRLFNSTIDVLLDISIARASMAIDWFVSTKAFNKLLELSLDYHEKTNTGVKIDIINRGVDKLSDLFNTFAWEFQPVVLQLLITTIIIFLTNWKIGLVFAFSVIPFVFITFLIYKSVDKLRAKRYDLYEKTSGELGDVVSNITVVKAYAQEERENNSYSSIKTFIRRISMEEFKKYILRGYGRNLLIEILYGILLILGLLEVKNHNLTLGGLVFLINLSERAYSNIYRMGNMYERAIESVESVNRLGRLFQSKTTVKNAQNAIKVDNLIGQIRFKNVTFAYRKKRVLKNVSFTIQPGSFTALVGKSGSGKSTIAKLLSRYYDPVRGQIIIDSKFDLKNLDLDSFRAQTAVVFQDSPVPNRQLWEVIAYSAGKTSFNSVKDRVEKAAKLSYAHDFIMDLEDGYKTLIGERGVKLSGGQRQRLAIARALFAQPQILIMDEPTSHLDTLSESLIQQALEDISKEHSFTKIIIAHRLSTVQNADQILVMDKGKLVEHGTHAQLLRQNGVYAQIVHQSELKN